MRRGLRGLRACAALGLVAGLAGCGAGAQPETDLHGAASDGLVYVLPDEDDVQRTDLWRARLSDGAARPFMVTPDRDETWPFWSQAASALVVETSPFGAGRSGRQRLVLWEDGRERDLPSLSAWRESWAAWAPVGTRLVYVFSGRRRPRTGLAVVDVESGEHRILVGGTRALRYLRPEFGPEGRRILAQRRTADPLTSRICLHEPGEEPRLLTDEGAFSIKARFTRDGRYVLYTRRPDPDGPGDVVRMRPDGSGARPFASAPESDDHTARGSPTRDEVAFISNRDGKDDLFVVPLSGGVPRNLTAEVPIEASAPRWSPDGERIVVTVSPYTREERRDRSRRRIRSASEILVVDREGGPPVLRTRGFSADWMPPWK